MNANRVRELAEYLLTRDAELNLQGNLQELAGALQNLGNSPGDPNWQNQVSVTRAQLEGGLEQLLAGLSPARLDTVFELRGKRFFTRDLGREVDRVVGDNTMTPHVAAQQIAQLRDARAVYLSTLQSAALTLSQLGIEVIELEPGSTELGFLLPREMFSNRFDQMVKELERLNKIIGAFAEAVLGSADEVKVKQISTSDPTFFLQMDVKVALEIAKTVAEFVIALGAVIEFTNALDVIKKLNLNKSTTEDLDAGTKQIVQQVVDKRVNELLGDTSGDVGRIHEQHESLGRAMNDLFARVERGMTIEIRFLPPHAGEGVDTPETEDIFAAFTELAAIAPRLEFPKALAEPLLKLSGPEDNEPPTPTP